MAKRKRVHRRAKPKIPVAVVAGFIPLATKAITDVQNYGIAGLQNTVTAIVPYNPATRRFTTANLHMGLFPILFGFAVHKLASAMGVNRALAQAKVPLIRI